MKEESKISILAEYTLVVVTIAFLFIAMYFIPGRFTGLAVIPPGANIINLTPTAAIDNAYIDQVSPDGGSLDGTVDASNNDVRWLTNDGDNINVTSWNQSIIQSTINNVTAYCEIDFVNPKGGDISFSYNAGNGWSNWLCRQVSIAQSIFKCNLYKNGVDSLAEVNNLDLRCRMNSSKTGAIGFSIDSMRLEVVYTITTTTSTSTSSTSTSTSTSSSSTTTSTSTPTSTSTSTSTSSTTSSSSSTSTTSSSTSSSTTTSSSSSTSTETSSSTTIIAEEQSSSQQSSQTRRRTSTTIEQIQQIATSSIVQTTTIIATTEVTTTSITQTTPGLLGLAGSIVRNNIKIPTKDRILMLIASISSLIYIAYRQNRFIRKHFKRKNIKDEIKKMKRKVYYK